MKLSIVVSTYNGENYIIEQLKSLLSQSRIPDEVIIIDDKSSDNTVEIIEKFIQDNMLNWKIIKNRKNKGWRKNFFDAINMASGEIIFPCDQDDVWCTNKLEVMENIMKENMNINLLVSNYNAFYSNGVEKIGPLKNNGKLEKITYSNKFFYVPYPGCTYCIRKAFANSVIKYWDYRFPHDAFYWRLACYSNSAYAINEVLIRWRKHIDSTYEKESITLRNYSERKKWFDYAQFSIETVRKYLIDNDYINKKQDKFLIDNIEFIKLRRIFYEKPNILIGLRLIKYMKYYMSLKRYLGDWYIVLFRRKGFENEN